MRPVFRSQVVFAGIEDVSLRTNSLIQAAANGRYQLAGTVFVAATANFMYHSFLLEKYRMMNSA